MKYATIDPRGYGSFRTDGSRAFELSGFNQISPIGVKFLVAKEVACLERENKMLSDKLKQAEAINFYLFDLLAKKNQPVQLMNGDSLAGFTLRLSGKRRDRP